MTYHVIAVGYPILAIVHLTSLVALVVANRTSIAPLSSFAFLALWIVLGLLVGISGARWSTIALILIATLGGYALLFTATCCALGSII